MLRLKARMMTMTSRSKPKTNYKDEPECKLTRAEIKQFGRFGTYIGKPCILRKNGKTYNKKVYSLRWVIAEVEVDGVIESFYGVEMLLGGNVKMLVDIRTSDYGSKDIGLYRTDEGKS